VIFIIHLWLSRFISFRKRIMNGLWVIFFLNLKLCHCANNNKINFIELISITFKIANFNFAVYNNTIYIINLNLYTYLVFEKKTCEFSKVTLMILCYCVIYFILLLLLKNIYYQCRRKKIRKLEEKKEY